MPRNAFSIQPSILAPPYHQHRNLMPYYSYLPISYQFPTIHFQFGSDLQKSFRLDPFSKPDFPSQILPNPKATMNNISPDPRTPYNSYKIFGLPYFIETFSHT
jgi:hypothetical protein